MIVGLDLGTTSISGVLFDPEQGQPVHCIAQAHRAEIEAASPACHEQCPLKILSISLDIIRSLTARASRPVQRLALTGQMHGLLAVDANLKPVMNLVTWRDQRAADSSSDLLNHEWGAETGCFLHPGYGGLTLQHLLCTGGPPKDTHKFLSIAGCVAAALTGRCSIDETFAASWGIWDLRNNRWHSPLLNALQIPVTLLPPYVPSCTPLGEVIDPTSLGLMPGAIVYSPLGDNQAGIAAVLEADAPEAIINLGTSAQLSVPLVDYAFSPQLETRPFPGGRFIQTYAALCGGWSYTYLAAFFQQVCQQIGGQSIVIADAIAAMDGFCSSPDTGGLEVDTRFAGARHDAGGRGSVTGIDTTNLTPATLTRGFVHGMVAELANAANQVDLSGIGSLVAVGNAVRNNPLLRSALESQFGLPCRMLEMPEEAATGAAKSILLDNSEVA